MITAQITVKPLGTKKVGTTDYRFYTPAGELLHGTGEWLITRHAGSSIFMRPAKGRLVTTVRIEIPEAHEIEQAAAELHDRGEPFEGTILGWPCQYRPRRTGRDLSTGQERVECAEFSLGISTVWLTVYRWLGQTIYRWTDDSAVTVGS